MYLCTNNVLHASVYSDVGVSVTVDLLVQAGDNSASFQKHAMHMQSRDLLSFVVLMCFVEDPVS